jgi:hypothetical protein
MWGRMLSLVPIAVMRSPRIAIACASGMAASTVTILPLRKTSVAGAGCWARTTDDISNKAAISFMTA